MADPVTFGGGFAQGFSGTFAPTFDAFSRAGSRRDELERKTANDKIAQTQENRKQAKGFMDRLIAQIKAGIPVSPELAQLTAQTAGQFDPDNADFFNQQAAAIASQPVPPVRGTEEDIEATGALAQAGRESSEEAAARAIAVDRAKILETPSRIVSSDDPFNEQFNLGIPEGESARVAFTEDEQGQVRASVKSRFGAGAVTTIDFSGLAQQEQVKALTKVGIGINQQKQAAIRVTRLSNRIVEVLGNDASPLAIVGFISRMGNSVTEQARAVAQSFGIEFDESNFNFDAFPETAVKSTQTRSNVLSLAFAVAKAREGGRLTDKDVQRALNTIGAGSGSTLQMRAALGEVVTDVIQSIDDFIVINRQSFEGSGVNLPSLLADDLETIGVTPLTRLETGGVSDLPPGIPPGSKLVDQTKDGLPVYRPPGCEGTGCLLVVQ